MVGANTTASFSDARFISPTAGTLVGSSRNGDVIATTADGGGTWTFVRTAGPTEAFLGVAFGDARHFWAVGTSGRIAASTDGGRTWAPQQSPTLQRLNGVWFIDADRGWAVGDGGTILRTTSGGRGGS